MRRSSGFTLIEVLVALLLGAVGLLGTLAVQQAVISASKTANDSAVALRLASQKLEEFSTVLTTGTAATTDAGTNYVDQFQSLGIADGNWNPNPSGPPTYLNAEGNQLPAGTTNATPEYRWARRWRVANVGSGQPYVISVTITYHMDTGSPKTIRLDMERRKSW